MGSIETQRRIGELRTEAFRLAQQLAQDAKSDGETPASFDAVTQLQTVANLLGGVESRLVEPESRGPQRKLSAA